ncbi:MAG: hypothetical protein Q8S13_02670 [Dehalococcoidia bacterium]|nr:hypothetical protein [Dehalococcoidia bacterium]
MSNRALLYHDESDARTRDACCPPLMHCLIRPPDPSDTRLLLLNPFKYPERFRDVGNARALWRKRFGSESPDPGKILIQPERLAAPSEDEVEYAEWAAAERIEGAQAAGRERDPAVARAIAEATGVPVEDIVIAHGRIDPLAIMGGESLYPTIEAWARSLQEWQIETIKSLLRLGQKWTLRKIQKEADAERRRALAADLVASFEPEQRDGIRKALTERQRLGFAELTGVNL